MITEKPSIANCLIVTLVTRCWAASIGGEHYTGKIHGETRDREYHAIEVLHKLSEKEAKYLNKKDGNGRGWTHRKGEWSGRFETREELERSAIQRFRIAFPDAIVLVEGEYAVCDPQRVLVGPEYFKEAANNMYEELEKIGGYEGDEKRSRELFLEYQKLEKRLKSEYA